MHDQDGIYFLTMTVVEWMDIFTRQLYKEAIMDSLRYCMKSKGLVVHAFVIMSNHLHMVISRTTEGNKLSDIIRDFKKFTAKKIIKLVQETKVESRKSWLLQGFEKNGKRQKTKYQFWINHNQPILLYSQKFIRQKVDYIHQNPVKAGLVYRAEDYIYSSASVYMGRQDENYLPVVVLDSYFSFD